VRHWAYQQDDDAILHHLQPYLKLTGHEVYSLRGWHTLDSGHDALLINSCCPTNGGEKQSAFKMFNEPLRSLALLCLLSRVKPRSVNPPSSQQGPLVMHLDNIFCSGFLLWLKFNSETSNQPKCTIWEKLKSVLAGVIYPSTNPNPNPNLNRKVLCMSLPLPLLQYARQSISNPNQQRQQRNINDVMYEIIFYIVVLIYNNIYTFQITSFLTSCLVNPHRWM
jgi:hypothetical protein